VYAQKQAETSTIVKMAPFQGNVIYNQEDVDQEQALNEMHERYERMNRESTVNDHNQQEPSQ
jgi:hypothetical protein